MGQKKPSMSDYHFSSLNGTWQLSSDDITCPAEVPGDVHTALLRDGRIREPYVGARVPEVRWVGQRDWQFIRTFAVSKELLALPHLWLEFEAIDTHAVIFLNGEPLGEVDNVFRSWRFDVSGRVRERDNRLEVRIASAHRVGLEKAAALPFPLQQGPYMKSPAMNLQRKVQCHGGWDWGPELLQHGLPGAVTLEGFRFCRLQRVVTEQTHEKGQCQVQVTVEIEGFATEYMAVELQLEEEKVTFEADISSGLNRVTHTFTIHQPKLWWPAGYGEQPLYALSVAVAGQRIEKRLGLRTVELVREPDAIGETFLFRVNAVDVVCKGANWIPCDSIWSRQTPAVYTRLVRDAKAANMNMLRIWGGGQYEPEIFYECCDEEGILIWHDLMFACAPYPSDPAFVENVRQEVTEQVGRLRDHPSIALWCGGNELLGSGTFKRQMAHDPALYMVNYERLSRALLEAVTEADPTRLFWPTSPCQGPDDFSGYWYDDTRGDTHFWDVGTGFDGKAPADADAYQNIRPRFCSEFGMLSFPSMETVESFIESREDLNLNSPVMRAHEQWNVGNRGIVEMFFAYTRLPGRFEEAIYVSQMIQALGIKQAVEYWRSTKPRNMGILFWMLNDIWPCPSWSSIDHGGLWKQLHYHARRFFDPVLTGGILDSESDTVHLFAVSDSTATLKGEARWRVIDLEGRVRSEAKRPIELDGQAAMNWGKQLVTDWTAEPDRTFLQIEMAGTLDDIPVTRCNTLFFRRFRDLPLQPAAIETQATIVDGRLSLTLSTDRPAFYVTIEGAGKDGFWSDNSVTLLPEEPLTLQFETRETMTESELGAVAERLVIHQVNAI